MGYSRGLSCHCGRYLPKLELELELGLELELELGLELQLDLRLERRVSRALLLQALAQRVFRRQRPPPAAGRAAARCMQALHAGAA